MSQRESLHRPPSIGRRRLSPVLAGLVAGCVLASLAAVIGATAVAQRSPAGARAIFDATHLPPLLRLQGEPVRLTYDVHCALEGVDDPEQSCDVSGTIHLRSGRHDTFRAIPLEPASTADRRELTVTVPANVASSREGFEYYAELREVGGAGPILVPGGGADAPHRSLPLPDPTEVDLGVHTFGSTARGMRVVSAPWGDGVSNVGLEPGRALPAIGASAFDVDDDGSVLLLDEAHGRVLRWGPTGTGPSSVQLSIDRRLADMALDDDGSIYVLESVAAQERTPLVRHFDALGRALRSVETAEPGPSQLRRGPRGPVVLQQPSHQWMPVAETGTPTAAPDQARRAQVGRPLRTGGEVVVLRRADEILVALVSNGRVRESWRVTSETALAEVQLAEPLGRRLVLVFRTYTDATGEFVVLALDRRGVATQFSTPTDEWAEAAPLGRFRISGRHLYRLGSDGSGAFVERYDMGAPS